MLHSNNVVVTGLSCDRNHRLLLQALMAHSAVINGLKDNEGVPMLLAEFDSKAICFHDRPRNRFLHAIRHSIKKIAPRRFCVERTVYLLELRLS